MLITDLYKIPIVVSLAVVVLLLGGSAFASLRRSSAEAQVPEANPPAVSPVSQEVR